LVKPASPKSFSTTKDNFFFGNNREEDSMSNVIKEQISCEEQLRRWVDGESVHRMIEGEEDGECCPDFSCCKPELLQPVEVRKAFAAADDERRYEFLGAFLGAAIQCAAQVEHKKDLEVYIAGKDPTKEV
jgi:hypothetical protein